MWLPVDAFHGTMIAILALAAGYAAWHLTGRRFGPRSRWPAAVAAGLVVVVLLLLLQNWFGSFLIGLIILGSFVYG